MNNEPSFNEPNQIDEEVLDTAPIEIALDDREERRHPRRRKDDIDLSHHAARCSICNHPDRDAIEQGYLHWENPTYLAHEYGLGQRRAVYRHAQALGLRQKRGERTRRNLEFVMEQAENVTATASDVIRAVRAYSCLSEDGRWTEPTKRVIIEHINRVTDDHSVAERVASANGAFEPSLATSHSLALSENEGPLVTESITLGDGHTMPSENAVTRAAPTKVQKLMDTLFTSFRRRFS